jgi:hypothetical protein
LWLVSVALERRCRGVKAWRGVALKAAAAAAAVVAAAVAAAAAAAVVVVVPYARCAVIEAVRRVGPVFRVHPRVAVAQRSEGLAVCRAARDEPFGVEESLPGWVGE